MQTFTVKVTGDSLSPADLKRYIYAGSDELTMGDIIVEQQ